jgi:hypothetical protein
MALGIIQVDEHHAPGTFLLFDESSAHLSSQVKYGTGKVIPKKKKKKTIQTKTQF